LKASLNTLKITHNFYALIITGVQMKKNEMGRACGTYGTGEVPRVLVVRAEERDHLEN
jgi:hypothetical protein